MAVRLYIGTHDGVLALTSQDSGRTWCEGPVTPLAHAAAKIGVAQRMPRRAYLAAYESGVYRTDDGGNTWRHLDSYPVEHAHSVAVHPGNPHVAYVGSEPAMVFKTTDGGATWTRLDSFAEVDGAEQWSFHWEGRHGHVRALALMPGRPDAVCAGIEVGGLVVSGDGGASWRAVAGTDRDVHTIAFSEAKPERVYAATAKGPFRSDDGGATWQPIMDGLDRRHSIPIAPAPDDPDRVLLGVAESARRKNAEACLSTDGGHSWRVLSGLSNTDDMVVALAWHPTGPCTAFAGTDLGRLYVSHDCGESWAETSVRLPRIAVGAMAAVQE
jgi:photosystem II stability/assembly factor-like uncharacterized protein